MDVSSFMGGNFLTQLDLPQPSQAWTIAGVDQQLVGTDQKVCLTFAEFPAKPLGLNKTNLRRIAELYSTNAGNWNGKQLLVYRSTTTYSGATRLCVRVCGATQAPPDPICDQQGSAVPYQMPQQAVPVQPVAAPVQQPVAPPTQQQPQAAAPWEPQQNSPPDF